MWKPHHLNTVYSGVCFVQGVGNIHITGSVESLRNETVKCMVLQMKGPLHYKIGSGPNRQRA